MDEERTLLKNMAKKSDEQKEPKAAKPVKAAHLSEEQLAKMPPATGPWLKFAQLELKPGRYLVNDVHGHYGTVHVTEERAGVLFYRGVVRDANFFKRFARIVE